MWRAPRPAAIAYARLKRVSVEEAERRLPSDAVTLADGIKVYLEEAGRGGGADLSNAPEPTRELAEAVVAAAREAGLVVDKVIVDGELVHIRLVSVCGSAVVTIAPDGTVEPTRSEGLEVWFEERRVAHRCATRLEVDSRYAELA